MNGPVQSEPAFMIGKNSLFGYVLDEKTSLLQFYMLNIYFLSNSYGLLGKC
mgnify:CR=1 FL=1